jgi:hypothetical protein
MQRCPTSLFERLCIISHAYHTEKGSGKVLFNQPGPVLYGLAERAVCTHSFTLYISFCQSPLSPWFITGGASGGRNPLSRWRRRWPGELVGPILSIRAARPVWSRDWPSRSRPVCVPTGPHVLISDVTRRPGPERNVTRLHTRPEGGAEQTRAHWAQVPSPRLATIARGQSVLPGHCEPIRGADSDGRGAGCLNPYIACRKDAFDVSDVIVQSSIVTGS